MYINVDVKREAGKARYDFRKYGKQVKDDLPKAILQACKVVQAEAKRRAPIDTGLLRGSIASRVRSKDGDIVGQVGTNVHYAIHVEYGHRAGKKGTFVPGRFFLKGALDSCRLKVTGVILSVLRKGD